MCHQMMMMMMMATTMMMMIVLAFVAVAVVGLVLTPSLCTFYDYFVP
jgi:hypothetical protein